MSSPLAVAAVTAALKDLLNDGLLNRDLASLGSFSVTALPPDRISTGQNEPNQLNLFLYQVTANQGWRNVGLPTVDGGGARIGHAPMALDLHYLLTAYGAVDLNAEVLLGYAMLLLHETPVLTRDQLRVVLAAPSPVPGDTLLPSPFGDSVAADLADQIELVKITPVFLSTEDLSKLWTAMQARYRLTMAYTASVVLIESPGGRRAPAPVLKRGPDDRGPVAVGSPFPTLTSARPAASDLFPALRLGDDVLITGSNLVNPQTLTALFRNDIAGVRRSLPVAPADAPGSLTTHLPAVAEDADAIHDWAPGVYLLSLVVVRPDRPEFPVSGIPVALAPVISVLPLTASVGDVVTVTATPRVRPAQEAATRVIFGAREIVPDTISTPLNDTTQPTTVTFTVPAMAPETYLVRLRVDGIDSLPVTAAGSPLSFSFDPQQRVTVT